MTPRRRAIRPLSDVVGALTDERAAQVLAIFNPYLYAPEASEANTPDAA